MATTSCVSGLSVVNSCIHAHARIADQVPTLSELTVLKYTDQGKKKRVEIINKASHKWKDIASLICDDTNKTSVLEKQYQNDLNECLRQVLIDNFIDKKPQNYAQDWNGLIELLTDIGLEVLAKEVKHALSCIPSVTLRSARKGGFV